MLRFKRIIKLASFIFSIFVLLPIIHCPVVYAQYPTKAIECIIPWPAGSASDIAIRMICKFAEKELGKAIVPINMVGGNCEIAWNHLRRSKPDGHTIGLITTAILENQIMGSEIKYDNFDYLLQFTHQPLGLLVHKDSGWKTIQDFVAEVKPKPGQATVAISAFGGIMHQGAYLLEKKYGIKLNSVPFKGATDSIASLLGKHVDSLVSTLTLPVPHLKEGTLRMLLSYTDGRLPDFPDVPTIVELGISDVGLESWRAVGIPKGVPESVKNILKTAFKKAYNNPEYQEIAKKAFFDLIYREHDEFLNHARKQYPLLERNLKEMGYLK